MFSSQSIKEKAIHIVPLSNDLSFTFQGIEFNIFRNNKKSRNQQDYILKRKDNNKRLSGLWLHQGYVLRGDILAKGLDKIPFNIEISEDRTEAIHIDFSKAIHLELGTRPDEQNKGFTGHYRGLQEGLKELTDNSQIEITSKGI